MRIVDGAPVGTGTPPKGGGEYQYHLRAGTEYQPVPTEYQYQEGMRGEE